MPKSVGREILQALSKRYEADIGLILLELENILILLQLWILRL